MNSLHSPVFLIGMMGAGKSHWARQLAAHFGVPFLDTDHMIEQKAEKKIAEIFREDGGEAKFREYERLLLEQTSWPKVCFVSCGGGFPCFHENMDKLLRAGKVIWLNPEADELVNRIWNEKQKRPLVASSESKDELKIRITDLLGKRAEFYQKADVIIDLPVPKLKDLLDALETLHSK